jgi:predicted anti-sigma-YlaC factor YlaD
MNCHEMSSKLPDVLFGAEGAEQGDAEIVQHLADCASCREQLAELRVTMALLDTWEAPEPNPYFLTRLNARLDEERQAAPANWFERVRARFVYGSRLTLRPVAAMVMTTVVLVGGGTYLGLNNWEQPTPQPAQAAVVHDLQTLDSNAQLLDQLETLSDQPDQNDDDSNGTT